MEVEETRTAEVDPGGGVRRGPVRGGSGRARWGTPTGGATSPSSCGSRPTSSRVRIRMAGRLDATTAANLDEVVRELLADGTRDIELCTDGLRVVDASAVGALADVERTVRRTGGTLLRVAPTAGPSPGRTRRLRRPRPGAERAHRPAVGGRTPVATDGPSRPVRASASGDARRHPTPDRRHPAATPRASVATEQLRDGSELLFRPIRITDGDGHDGLPRDPVAALGLPAVLLRPPAPVGRRGRAVHPRGLRRPAWPSW